MASEGDGGSDQRAVFRTTPLVAGFDGKIECLTHYSSRVVIGSSDGRLVMFDTRKGPSTSPSTFYQFAHGRPVEQLIAVPHIRLVIVVANGELSAHGATDLKPLDFDFSMANAPGVRVCCINQRGPPHFRLGVALLRRNAVMIYQYHSSDKSYQYLREFPTLQVPETMSWYRNKVFVGYRTDYHILNDKGGEAQPINSPGIQNAQVSPVVKLLPNEEVLISVLDRVGVFVGLNGEPLPKNSITWTQAPTAVEFTPPYIIGFIPKVGIEIHNSSDNSFVQMLPIHRGTAIFSNGMKFDMEPRPSGDSENVVVVGIRESSSGGSSGGVKSSVIKVEQMPMDQQIGELLDRGKIQEAQEIVKKSIAGLSTDKQKSKTKRFQRQATVALLRLLEFDAAADYMFRSAVEPCEFIAFFPEFQCASFAYEPSVLKPEVLPRGASVSPDITAVIQELLETQSQTGNLASEIARADPQELVEAATKALMKFLDKYKSYMRDKAAAQQRNRAPSRARSVSGASSSSGSSAPKDARRAEAIDTALFRLYVKYNKQKELLVLISDNGTPHSDSNGSGSGGDGAAPDACSLELKSCEALLERQQLFYELAHLFAIQGKFREAVELLAQLHAGNCKQANGSSSNPTPKKPVDAAIDLLITVPEAQQALIFEQSVWIMRATDVKHALRVFTDRRVKLPSNDVLDHLKAHSDDPAIVQKYLETLVKSERDQLTHASSHSSSHNSRHSHQSSADVNDSYSNFLAGDGDADKNNSSFSGTAGGASSSYMSSSASGATVGEDPHHTRLAMEYIDEVLKLVNAGEAPSKSSPGKEPGALGDARKRLLRFLKSSSSRYDASQLIAKIQRTPLYNELVILCGRGGFHEEAVRALVLELNDLKGAESYATKYGFSRGGAKAENKTKTERNDALLELLKICFNPPEESKKAAYTDYAFQLLGRHGKTMDGKQVLDLIPASTPLNKLVEYFSQCLPHSAHNVRETRIGLSLSNIYNLQVQCDRVEKLHQYVEIDTATTCFACKKRIGDIMFAVYPHGKVVHYNCMNGRPDVCPVTGEKFS